MSISYYSYNQSERLFFDDTSSLLSMIPALEDEWVPYLRCELCGRKDHCHYAEKLDDQSAFKEIKCGVISQALKGLITLSETHFARLPIKEKQKYVDALYYLVQYIISSDTFVAALQKPDELVENYGSLVGVRLIGGVSDIRESINKACALLKEIPFVGSKRIMLLVEGASEEAFINRLLIRDSYPLFGVEVKSYESESNKKYNVLRMLIQEYKNEGYHVLIQVDVDGKPEKLNKENLWGLKEHVQKGLLTISDIFPFTEDLEASFPAELLCEALNEMCGYSETLVCNAIYSPVSTKNTIYKRLTEDLGNMPNKPRLAKEIADLVSDYDLVNDSNFASNEIVSFVKFLENKVNEIQQANKLDA